MTHAAPRLEVFEDAAKDWRWRLRAANGKIVSTGEAHRSPRDAERGARQMVRVLLRLMADDAAVFAPVHAAKDP